MGVEKVAVALRCGKAWTCEGPGDTTFPMQLRGPILGVWAHPDDESFLSAGLMVRALRDGQRVVCVTATRGELGIQDPERWPAEQILEIRTEELQESLRILGVTEHHWLDYPDSGCASVDLDEAVARLCGLMEEVRPATVLTFGPDGMTAHPDHIAVSAWATAAFEKCASVGAQLLYATMTQRWADEWLPHLPDPSMLMMDPRAEIPICPQEELFVAYRCPDDIFELKTRSLKAQTSQIGTMIAIFGDPGAFEVNRTESFRLGSVR